MKFESARINEELPLQQFEPDILLEALRESEERFWVTFESAPVGMGLISPEGNILRANAAASRMVGFSQAELKKHERRGFIYPPDRELDRDLWNELVAGERESYQVEKRYVRKSGEIFWARLHYAAVRSEGGQLLYVIGMLEDINEHKRTLAELSESEELFRKIFENAAVGIGLVGLNRVLFAANDAMVNMSGYTREEFLGMSGEDLIHPDDNTIGRDDFQAMLEGRRDSIMVERRYVRKEGVPFWVRQNISVVRHASGEPHYLVVLVEDIDRQKNMLRELQESEARFRAMFANTEIGVALLSLNRKVIEINPALEAIFGYKLEDLDELNLSGLVHPDDRMVGEDLYEEMSSGQRSGFTVELRFIRKDGHLIWARVTYSIVPDSTGEARYHICLFEDIDEQRSARERLKAQEEQHLRTLEQRVEERTRALAATNRHLMKEMEQRFRAEEALAHKAAEDAVNAERTRLARDLHDAVTQTLFSASLIADVLPDLWEIDPAEARRTTEELRQLARGSLAEMRTLLLELRPDAITQANLGDLLKQLSQALIGRAQLPVHLDVHGERSLPPDVQVAFYRIAQESLNNIVKYARAGRVDILLALNPEGALMQICDDGIGFDKSTIRPSSLGMRIMRERAQGIGANFEISSRIGEGSTVSVSWVDPKPDGEHTPHNEEE